MGAGGRIAHQSHSVGVGLAEAPSSDEIGEPGDGRLWHRPFSTAVHTLAMDPATGELTVYYHRFAGVGVASRGYPLSNVSEQMWQRLISGDESVGQLIQELANDPAHQPGPPIASDDAQRLIDALRTVGQDMAEPASTAMPVQRRGAAAAAAELAAESRAAADARTEAAEPARDRDGVSYLADPAAFQRDYNEAAQRAARGEHAIPYLREDATGGLGARDGGRAFGVEIEFDLPPGSYGTQQIIARELHEAGITSDPDIHGYHEGRGRNLTGYTDAPNGWRLERDGSVSGGELVSPIMYDEPQTWANLERACEIIRRHGGRASVNAGSHVTVGTADYGHSVEPRNRLLNTVSGYEDTLYRLATNPERGRHRLTQGNAYCSPNNVPAQGYTSLGEVAVAQGGHHRGLNLQHNVGARTDRAEFRLWDASIDPAVIQSQIKLSLGIADAAGRGATGGSTRREPLGSHRENNPNGERLTGASWLATTESFRSLVDSVFHRTVDKAQMAALFAATRRWQQVRR